MPITPPSPITPDFTGAFNGRSLQQILETQDDTPSTFRQALTDGGDFLKERFQQGVPVEQLVAGRTWLVDQILLHAWSNHLDATQSGLALVAVGGYGRGELHPASDIDLLVLLAKQETPQQQATLSAFLTFLWDIGLEVGHSVRTIDECGREAHDDITVATNLMEARHLAGDPQLTEHMRSTTGPEAVWTGVSFFEAKCQEQKARYRRYDDTAAKLEPNIKEGPGGLRDIHTVAWVLKRHFHRETLDGLVQQGFLTRAELQTLVEGQLFLWRIRFALHLLTGRREDRLLFDHQRAVADLLGYQDSEHDMAVEQLMQAYYRTAMENSRLNEMLLQLFQEAILFPGPDENPQQLDQHFQVTNGYLEVRDPTLFQQRPLALLEIFLVLQQHPGIKGVRATTIRLIRSHRHLIDDVFRGDLGARSLFMEILRQPQGLTHELRRMNRYGILAAYLPEFRHVVGRMQYDLFHIYTVDEHTLFVVRNLRRIAVPEFANELPLCSHIFKTLPKPELLYLAGLFHDIGKGRGGDHSALGAVDTEAFCNRHGLSPHDTRLTTWLVANHLTMSVTAQRQDLSDPEVIRDFAIHVGSPVRLDYLFLLTCADIRATNPDLWNSFKESLLRELYFSTQQAFRRGLHNPVAVEEQIAAARQEVLRALQSLKLDTAKAEAIWQQLSDDYFSRFDVNDLLWHTQTIIASDPKQLPLVEMREQTERGSSEILIYTPDRGGLFTRAAAVFDSLGLSVADARITSAHNGYSLDTFQVLEENGQPVRELRRRDEILKTLRRELSHPNQPVRGISRRNPRQYRHFPIPTQVEFSLSPHQRRTLLEIVTADRPGLLSTIASVFQDCGVRMENARIATFGSRAEDIFCVTDTQGRALSGEKELRCLRERLRQRLDQ